MWLRRRADLTQVAAISGSMMMPCLRSTIASLGTSGESQYSVAVLLGAIGAEQTLFSIIGPAIWPPIWAETESDMPALSFYIATALCAGGIVATMALPPLETIEAKASAAAMKVGDHGGRYDTIDSPTIRYRRSDGPGVPGYRKPLLADERARYQYTRQ